jgi:hypothetical protein
MQFYLKSSLLITVILVLFGCSDITENLVVDIPSKNDIAPDNVQTLLPVINIQVDPDEFGFMYDHFTEDLTSNGYFNIYRHNAPMVENYPMVMQIKGGVSANFPLKAFEVRFDSKQDNREFSFINPSDLLPFHSIDEIENIRLRNSGNDFDGTMIKDISYTQLAIEAGLDLDLMYSEQAVVFLNNRFFGIMNIRTESNARGIAALYGVDRRDVTMAKIDKCIYGGCTGIRNGDSLRVQNLLDAISNKDIDYLYNEVDVSNFIDYIIFQTYIANWDWPYNNVRFFAIGDSKFRFFVFDLDQSNTTRLSRDHHFYINTPLLNPVRDLFNLFYDDPEFRKNFYDRYKYLLESGKMSSEKFREITNAYSQNIENLIPIQIEKYNAPERMVEWYKNVEMLNHNFALREVLIKKIIFSVEY